MPFKRFLCLLMALTLWLGVCVQAEENAPSIQVSAKAALLMEPATGKILLEQNAHEKLPPASVTKVMTMLLIYESVDRGKIKWDDVVTVSQHAASMGGSQIYLEPMEQQTVRDLTKSIVIASANDAAVAMSEFIAGSEDGFVVMMNNKAAELGMSDTHFVNACGLDADGHVTSAHDIAVMSRELINRYPDIFQYSTTWMDTIIHKTARGEESFGLSNTNRLIKNYAGATGLKTGSTSEALYCISATAKRDGMQLIAVVMAAPDPNTRFHEAMKMLDYGFASFSVVPGDESGAVKGSVRIMKGETEEMDVCVKNQVSALVAKGNTAALESKVELLGGLNAPVEKGAKAGEVIYYFEGKEVGRSDLVTVEAVERANLRDTMGRLFVKWFR